MPRDATREIFTVVFYNLRVFGCKTVQVCVMQREYRLSEIPSVRNAAQTGEKAC